MRPKQVKAISLLLMLLIPTVVIIAFSLSKVDALQRFHSYGELQAFINSNAQTPSGFETGFRFGPAVPAALTAGGNLHSTTNIQVAGVDEADTVKNDGQYIYTISGTHVFIVQAYPTQTAQIMSTLSFQGYPLGLYLDGDRLAVLWLNTTYTPCVGCYRPLVAIGSMMPIFWPLNTHTIIQVFDITDHSNPVLRQTNTVEGSYLGSRMIGDYLYLITQHWVWDTKGDIVLPALSIDGRSTTVPPQDIYYSPQRDYSFVYTMVLAVNVQDNFSNPSIQTYLLGASSTIYVSPTNLYLTTSRYAYNEGDTLRTIIHRIHLDGSGINYEATGSVPGFLLNQYSLDEYNGFLRVATTIPAQFPIFARTTGITPTPTTSVQTVTNSTNNLYILNLNLHQVSSIEGLAEGEHIYASRFLGDRGYLDTFKKIDPLFVLDLSNPYHPSVLGSVTLPGYSSFLLPYDSTHVIGIGKETADSGYPSFAWYEGIKIALFDVSDPTQPQLIANITIGDRGTDSDALRDPHALLWDPTRNLLVLPIHLAVINPSEYGGSPPPYAYGQFVWQGVYVFKITPDQGIMLQGTSTHENATETSLAYWNYNSFITRSLYIENILYTLSTNMIQMHDINTLALLGKIQLP